MFVIVSVGYLQNNIIQLKEQLESLPLTFCNLSPQVKKKQKRLGLGLGVRRAMVLVDEVWYVQLLRRWSYKTNGNNKYIIIGMLSPQSKTSLSNNTSNNVPRQKFPFLLKTCSTSAFKSVEVLQDQPSNLQAANYSKLLKQKDIKILNLMEKVRALESDLARYENTHNILQNDLQFFRAKFQEELYRKLSLQSEMEAINSAISSFLTKIRHAQGNRSKLQYQPNTEQTHLECSKRLLTSLESQIPQIGRMINLHKKQANSKADAQKPSARRAVDSDDYKEQILTLREEREFIKDLLVNCEKEKNEIANDGYEIARGQYKIDFYHMNKPQVVKLCIELLAKLKQLQNDNAYLINKLKTVETLERQKYENMLKTVRQLQKKPDKKVSIKRMSSMNLLQP